jgi:hypothetical protein
VAEDGDRVVAKLKIRVELRARLVEILTITDEVCEAHLDREYGELCRVLVGAPRA